MKTVKITANPEGQAFTIAKNADGTPKLGKDGKQYGFIRLEETEPRINWENGVAKVTSARSALKTFTAEDFEKVKNILTPGKILSGHIIRHESTTKFGNAAQMTAGEGGVGLTHNGAPVYCYMEFDESGQKADIKLAYDQSNNAVASSIASEVNAALS